MKKIKLLMPILGISTIAATAIPLASCGCKPGGQTDPDVPTVQKSYSLTNSAQDTWSSSEKIEKNVLYTVTFTVTEEQAAIMAAQGVSLDAFCVSYTTSQTTSDGDYEAVIKKVEAPTGWEIDSESKKIKASSGAAISKAGNYTFKFYTKSDEIKSEYKYTTKCYQKGK